jgi:hypothetical protein
MAQRLKRIWRDDRSDEMWIVRWAGPQTLSFTLNASVQGNVVRYLVPWPEERPLADFSNDEIQAALDSARNLRSARP